MIRIGFAKVRFTSRKHGATAGLVFTSDRLAQIKSVAELSHAFPYSESLKMEQLEVSPHFPTFAEAFAYEFPEVTA